MDAEENAKMPTAKTALRVIAYAVALAAPFLLARYYKTAVIFPEDPEVLSATLEREAAELNATLPEMVSEGVRLDKVTVGPGNSFNYNYTIVDDDAARNMAANSNKLSELRKQLNERVCWAMPDRRANGTTVTYALRDNKGAILADISINPEDC